MVRVLAIAAIAVAAACSNSPSYGNPPPPPPPGPPPPPPPPPPPGGHSTTITVGNGSNSFSPTPDTIPAGTITFHWASTIQHNVTWLTGPSSPAASGNRAGGDQDYATTVVVGTYTYHCTIHAGMNGTLVVQ